ncbi:MAG: hypothetical protein ACJAX5_000066 [Patiriisocius sp.]|jgi:hypothetical protein
MQHKSKQTMAEAQFGIYPPKGSPLSFLPQFLPRWEDCPRRDFFQDLNDFYYTLSDTNFSQFDVLTVSPQDTGWSQPRETYFSSNRPSGKPGMLEDWKIRRCASVNDA